MTDQVHLRSASAADGEFLARMLVEAVNWHPDRNLPPSQITDDPVLARYVAFWPRDGDLGVVAETDGAPAGAAWLRLFPGDSPGFGYVADDVPELSMAVVAEWRARGVGRLLLRGLVRRARLAGHAAISLSVERANTRAHRLYTEEGFRVVESGADADTMLLDL